MMKSSLALVLAIVLWCAAPATADTSKPATPTRAFAAKSFDMLRSRPTVSNARWQELARTNTPAILAALAAAERKGWTPLSTTTLTRGGHRVGLRPIGAQEDMSNGAAEMLVWDWDDGNPDNVEGMVYFRSFATGNSATFTVQIDAPVYDATEIPYYEVAASTYAQSFEGAAGPAPAAFFGQRGPGYGATCGWRGLKAGDRCMRERVRERLRDGLRNAAVDAGIGAVIGCRTTGTLAGCLAGGTGGAQTGFLSGVIGSMIWGTDFDCIAIANATERQCMIYYEICTRSRSEADCRASDPERERGRPPHG